jgi:hypothetical protein
MAADKTREKELGRLLNYRFRVLHHNFVRHLRIG